VKKVIVVDYIIVYSICSSFSSLTCLFFVHFTPPLYCRLLKHALSPF